MCNVTYRLEKIDRSILFELAYNIKDVTSQITANISYTTNCTNPDIIESHNRIFPIFGISVKYQKKPQTVLDILKIFTQGWVALRNVKCPTFYKYKYFIHLTSNTK